MVYKANFYIQGYSQDIFLRTLSYPSYQDIFLRTLSYPNNITPPHYFQRFENIFD